MKSAVCSSESSLGSIGHTCVLTENLVKFLCRIDPASAVFFFLALADGNEGLSRVVSLRKYFCEKGNRRHLPLRAIFNFFRSWRPAQFREIEELEKKGGVVVSDFTFFDTFRLHATILKLGGTEQVRFGREVNDSLRRREMREVPGWRDINLNQMPSGRVFLRQSPMGNRKSRDSFLNGHVFTFVGPLNVDKGAEFLCLFHFGTGGNGLFGKVSVSVADHQILEI